MKKHLSLMLIGTIAGLLFLLLGLASAVLFLENWNVLFLLGAILGVVAMFGTLWWMQKRKLDLEDSPEDEFFLRPPTQQPLGEPPRPESKEPSKEKNDEEL